MPRSKMEARATSHIGEDESEWRDAAAASLVLGPDDVLHEQNRSLAKDSQYMLGSVPLSSSDSEEANDRLLGTRGAGSLPHSPSDFVQSRAEQGKGQAASTESPFMRTAVHVHPTRWQPWPPSRKLYSVRGEDPQKWLHYQRSVPEELLCLRSGEDWDVRESGRSHVRSMSFPRGRGKCADSDLSIRSLASLTTAASSVSGTSLYSFFTRRHSDIAAILGSAEQGSCPPAEMTQGCPQMLQKACTPCNSTPAGVVDELSYRSLHSLLVKAELNNPPCRARLHTSDCDKHCKSSSHRARESVQGTSETLQSASTRELASCRDCGAPFESRSGSLETDAALHLLSAVPRVTSAPLKRTRTLPCSKASSSALFLSTLALAPRRKIDAVVPRATLGQTEITEAPSDRSSMVVEDATSQAELRPTRSLGPNLFGGHSPALPRATSSARGEATLERASEGRQMQAPQVPGGRCNERKTDAEKAGATVEFRAEAPVKAEACRCPAAPRLSYEAIPPGHVPELILGDIAAAPDGGLTHTRNRGTGLAEQPDSEKSPATSDSRDPEPGSCQSVQLLYSSQLQRALSAIACRAGAISHVAKRGAGDP